MHLPGHSFIRKVRGSLNSVFLRYRLEHLLGMIVALFCEQGARVFGGVAISLTGFAFPLLLSSYLAPTLCVGVYISALCANSTGELWDAERPGMHPHAERGDEGTGSQRL